MGSVCWEEISSPEKTSLPNRDVYKRQHLYMLQTRNGKRTAQAALQIACDLVDEGMITEQEACLLYTSLCAALKSGCTDLLYC